MQTGVVVLVLTKHLKPQSACKLMLLSRAKEQGLRIDKQSSML
jgi:hypothetical protein